MDMHVKHESSSHVAKLSTSHTDMTQRKKTVTISKDSCKTFFIESDYALLKPKYINLKKLS